MPKAIISNATIPRLAVGTANTATPTDVVSDNSQPAILLDITQLAALGLTNHQEVLLPVEFTLAPCPAPSGFSHSIGMRRR